jgi:ribonuclease III
MAEDTHPLEALEERTGYRFGDLGLLLRALTHPSFSKGGREIPHNQRLEFLGDAVLGFVAAEALFREFPDEREGILTRNRSMLVNGQTLYELAREIGLGPLLRIGEAEDAQGGRERPSILEDAFEALIGAVFLDGGMAAAREVALRLYGPLEARLSRQTQAHNPKGRLQELLQPRLGNDAIEYRLIADAGPDHRKEFTVEVWIEGACRGAGTGYSKKEAEEAAATMALEGREEFPDAPIPHSRQ